MAHANEARLVASLPKDITKLLTPAINPDASPKRASKAFVKVLRELKYPVSDAFTFGPLTKLTDSRWRGVMPLPSELTLEQRAVAELLARRDGMELFYFEDGDWQLFKMPETAANRRRWLGIDPPGPLEQDVTYKLGGKTTTEPGWHALQRAIEGGTVGVKEAFASMTVQTRLRLLGGLVPISYGLTSVLEWLHEFFTLEGIGVEHAAWAREQAERLLGISAREGRRVRFVVFPALVRARVPLEERYWALLPFEPNPNLRPRYDALMKECLGAIAEDRREAAVMASLARETPDDRGAISWTMLEELPYSGVAKIALDGTFAQDVPKILARLDKLAEKHDAVRGVVDAYRRGKAKKGAVPALACGKSFEPKDADELTQVQKKQLEVFGKEYDGRKLSAAKRLARGAVEEGAFGGFVEFVEILEKGTDRVQFEAVLMIDSGSVFKAGSTREVAAFIQGSLDQCKDPELFEELKRVFAERNQTGKKR